jgi:hypothetical protein
VKAHPKVDRKRHQERVARLLRKREKLEMLESLILEHEKSVHPDLDYLKSLKKRANDIRTQLSVISTVLTK